MRVYCDTVEKARSFDFDDPVPLNDAYYNKNGFIEGEAFFYLLQFPSKHAFRSFQQLVDSIILNERLACSVLLCCTGNFSSEDATEFEQSRSRNHFPFQGKATSIQSRTRSSPRVVENRRSTLLGIPAC